jgi:hypothetical protein
LICHAPRHKARVANELDELRISSLLAIAEIDQNLEKPSILELFEHENLLGTVNLKWEKMKTKKKKKKKKKKKEKKKKKDAEGKSRHMESCITLTKEKSGAPTKNKQKIQKKKHKKRGEKETKLFHCWTGSSTFVMTRHSNL